MTSRSVELGPGSTARSTGHWPRPVRHSPPARRHAPSGGHRVQCGPTSSTDRYGPRACAASRYATGGRGGRRSPSAARRSRPPRSRPAPGRSDPNTPGRRPGGRRSRAPGASPRTPVARRRAGNSSRPGPLVLFAARRPADRSRRGTSRRRRSRPASRPTSPPTPPRSAVPTAPVRRAQPPSGASVQGDG